MNGITGKTLRGMKQQTNRFARERGHFLLWKQWQDHSAEARCKHCDGYAAIQEEIVRKYGPTYPPYVSLDDTIQATCVPADNLVWDLRVKMEQVWDNDAGESYRFMATFPLYLTDEQIVEIVKMSGYDVEGNHCQHSYDCCGHWYSSGLSLDRMNTKVVASIGVSLNV